MFIFQAFRRQGLAAMALGMAALIAFTSCSSTTLISSAPSGAEVYLNGEKMGKTPYSHTDTKIVGTCTTLRLEKEGYETFTTVFCRNEEADVGAIIGGVLFLFPFLWTMKYKPGRLYELEPSVEASNETIIDDSKRQKLLELKEMYDDGLINKEEYDAERKKILQGA